MPKLGVLKEKTNSYVNSISHITGIPTNVVEDVLEGIRLSILHDIYLQGVESAEAGELTTSWARVDLPYVGTILLKPINRKKVSDGVDGYTFKTYCRLNDKFIDESKNSYYNHHDYLRDVVVDGFKKCLANDYKSLL